MHVAVICVDQMYIYKTTGQIVHNQQNNSHYLSIKLYWDRVLSGLNVKGTLVFSFGLSKQRYEPD